MPAYMYMPALMSKTINAFFAEHNFKTKVSDVCKSQMSEFSGSLLQQMLS